MKLRRGTRSLAALAPFTAACWMSSAAYSAEWDGFIAVEPGLVYTDNVCLTKNNKKDDWTGVATVTPVGSVRVNTSRTTASFGGDISVNALSNSDLRDNGCTGDDLDDRERWFPRLYGDIKTELITNLLNLDANIRADQNQVNSARGSSNDGLNRNGNDNTFYRYAISPSTSRKFGADMTFNGRYTYSEVVNSSNQANDSFRHAVNASLGGGAGPRVKWNLSGRYSLTGYSDDFFNINTGEVEERDDTELSGMSLRTSYEVSRRWEVNGTYGWEWNDFQSSSNANQGGSAWDIGITWTPSSRTIVTLGSGDRFFGKTPRVAFTHKRRRMQIDGTYRKDITFQRDLATVGLGELEGGFSGDSINNAGRLPSTSFDLNGEPNIGLGTTTSITSNSAILDERATLAVSYEGRPGRATLFGSYSQQTRAEDGAQADFTEAEVAFSPNWSRKFSVTASIGYRELLPGGFRSGSVDFNTLGESEEWYYRLSYRRPVGDIMSMQLEYRHTDRRANVDENEYQENLVKASLRIEL